MESGWRFRAHGGVLHSTNQSDQTKIDTIDRPRLILIWLLCCAALDGLPVGGALSPAQVPVFQIRARVTASATGKPEALCTFQIGSSPVLKTNLGAWSGWMSFDRAEVEKNLKGYPAVYMNDFPIVTHLRVTPISESTVVEAELMFEGGQKAFLLKGDLFGPNLGILVWRDKENRPQAATMAEYNRRYWEPLATGQGPVRRPRFFPIIDRFIGGDDNRLTWQEGIQELSKAGFNALMLPPSAQLRELLLDAGLSRTAWATYNPPGYAFDYGLEGGALSAWARKEVAPYLKAGFSPRDFAAFAMSDEPGWYYPSMFNALTNSPAGLGRFRRYIQEQGLTPAELGTRSWEDIFPIGQSRARDLASRKIYYCTMRFFAWDSARHFANSTRALEGAFYTNMPVFVNWNFFSSRFYVPGGVANNPDKQSPDSAMGGHDWLEFGRLRGCTMLWTEDWFPDAMAYQWSFYCAKLRCAAEAGGVQFGGYIIPRTAGDREEGILQKILCVAGSGGKCLKYFVFGPEYNFPGNCYSENARVLPKMAEAHSMIAAAEEVLWPGRRPKARVAIVLPRSSELWDPKPENGKARIEDATNNHLNNNTVDYMAEVFDLYLALQHSNVPVDFVDEEELSIPGLKGYRVVYLTEPNLPVASMRGLLQWVRRGGILVRSPNSGTMDQYNEPSPLLADVVGLSESPRERTIFGNLKDLKPSGRAQNGNESFVVAGPRSRLGNQSNVTNLRSTQTEGRVGKRESPSPPPWPSPFGRGNSSARPPEVQSSKVSAPPGQALLTFEDGGVGVFRSRLGAGEVVHFSWFPGLSYAASESGKKDKLPVGFSETIRKWIVLPTKLAKVQNPVVTGHAMVETPMLLTKGGAAITLLNWSGEDISELAVTARLPFKAKRVESVQHGPLKFERRSRGVTFRLALKAGDIVVVKE